MTLTDGSTDTRDAGVVPDVPRLRGLSVLVPPTVLVQEEVAEVFAAQPGISRLAQRLIATSFGAAGVARRHTVVEELSQQLWEADELPTFYDHASGELRSPGTAARNAMYARYAGTLATAAGRRALATTPGLGAGDVTHVITVSCTGFYAPGPDFEVARDLGLQPGVQRYHLGFMGCYAALPALRLAAQLCEVDADAVVLVVSVELCTLHLRASEDTDTIVATSLFADGVGAALVTRRPPGPGERTLELERFATRTTPDGEREMAWRIGDHGFEMVLSTAVPAIIGTHVIDAVEPLLRDEPALAEALRAGTAGAAIPHWAVHPGGRSILDRVERALALAPEQLGPSRRVLHDYGNMSSATVLFVLREILDSAGDGERVAAMAFGPGLTVESALLTVQG